MSLRQQDEGSGLRKLLEQRVWSLDDKGQWVTALSDPLDSCFLGSWLESLKKQRPTANIGIEKLTLDGKPICALVTVSKRLLDTLAGSQKFMPQQKTGFTEVKLGCDQATKEAQERLELHALLDATTQYIRAGGSPENQTVITLSEILARGFRGWCITQGQNLDEIKQTKRDGRVTFVIPPLLSKKLAGLIKPEELSRESVSSPVSMPHHSHSKRVKGERAQRQTTLDF